MTPAVLPYAHPTEFVRALHAATREAARFEEGFFLKHSVTINVIATVNVAALL